MAFKRRPRRRWRQQRTRPQRQSSGTFVRKPTHALRVWNNVFQATTTTTMNTTTTTTPRTTIDISFGMLSSLPLQPSRVQQAAKCRITTTASNLYRCCLFQDNKHQSFMTTTPTTLQELRRCSWIAMPCNPRSDGLWQRRQDNHRSSNNDSNNNQPATTTTNDNQLHTSIRHVLS